MSEPVSNVCQSKTIQKSSVVQYGTCIASHRRTKINMMIKSVFVVSLLGCCVGRMSILLALVDGPRIVVDAAMRSLSISSHHHQRHLGNNNNYYYYSEDDANSNGDDDDNDDAYNNQVDLTSHALKYVSCKNIHSFDSDTGGLRMHRFVVARLCGSRSCSSYNPVGCNGGDYVDYLLPVSDYMQIVQDYHLAAKQKYCATCPACLNFELETDDGTNAAYSNGDDAVSGDDGYSNKNYGYSSYYAAAGDDAAYDDYYNDDHYSTSSQNAYPWYIGSSGECIYETVCQNYESVCDDVDLSNYNNNDDDGAQSQENYFDCTLHEDGKGYAAAHCAADGVTIEIGRYSDDTCSTYTGETVSSLDLTYYDSTCLSCKGQDAFSLVSEEEIADGKVITYPFCSALYDESAQCNPNNSNQGSNHQLMCNFIEAVVANTYDEYGEIYAESNTRFGKNRHTSAGQIFMLFVTLASTVGLSSYVFRLHRKLQRRKPWTPPGRFTIGCDRQGSDPALEAGRLSRHESGSWTMRSSVSGDSAQGYVAPYSGTIPHRRTAPSHDDEQDDDTHAARKQPEMQHQLASPIQSIKEDVENDGLDETEETQPEKVLPEERDGVFT